MAAKPDATRLEVLSELYRELVERVKFWHESADPDAGRYYAEANHCRSIVAGMLTEDEYRQLCEMKG